MAIVHLDNPAGRLAEILRRAASVDHNTDASSGWKQALDATDDVDLFHKILMAVKLINDGQAAVDATGMKTLAGFSWLRSLT